MRSEIGAVYGPLVIATTAITSAAGSTAGEEEDGILVGLIAGVAIGGGGVSLLNLTALALHLAFFGFAVGALALALAAATGRRALASGGAAGFALLGFLINGFAPLVDGAGWLKYLSPFYYYAGSDPIGSGLDLGHLAILAAVSLALTVVALVGISRRDLRA